MSLNEHRLLPDAPFADYAAYRTAWGEQAIDLARRRAPGDVLDEVQHAGLRGRGGAGFPTGTKWASVAHHECATRQVICNAAEGEPGTFKDRWLLRQNPYAVLEGMLIAAHVVGARELYIGLKASFEPELARLRAAHDEMRQAGLFDGLTLQIVEGPEEYLFGEEKALLEVLEGGEPLPREAHYPPYERGLNGTAACPNPAVVNNAETFGHVPSIVRAGAASFRELGTRDTPGTLLYTVSGDVQRPGVYEREAGMRLADLFQGVAGGPREGRRFKAALSGVAVAPIEADRFATRADFGSLHLIGSGLGSAGFIVLDDATSMPRVAQAIARFLYVESCNQCSACKAGLRIASEAIDELFDPEQATEDDAPRAIYGARSAPQGNRCYLPVQGSIIVPTLLKTFRREVAAQLDRPAAPTLPWPLPKLVDYFPDEHRFELDERQAFKTPDWLYDEPPTAPPSKRPVKSARPADKPRDAPDLSIRIRGDLVAALRDRADSEAQSIDAIVDRAVRAWLDAGG
jgi:NADH-quinone oxidoreductase subunit F